MKIDYFYPVFIIANHVDLLKLTIMVDEQIILVYILLTFYTQYILI